MVKFYEYALLTDKEALVKITNDINKAIQDSGVINGIVTIETKHSTASVLKITAYGQEVLDDIRKEMRNIVPARINFKHQDAPENAAGHIKSSLFGSSLSLIVKEGKLICEDSQDIYFYDYDGPRHRTYCVCVIGE